MLILKKKSFEDLCDLLVAAHYACDHDLASRVLDEMQERPEYDTYMDEEEL